MSLAPARDSATATAIIAAIRAATRSGEASLALHEPRFAGNEWKYLKDCLDSTFVSSVGAYVDRFERDLASATGARHAIAVVNGTAALHVALLLAGVEAGDEVIVPTLTFIATANAVSYCGAVPHFADSAADTLGLDPDKLGRHLDSIVSVRAGQAVNRATGRRIAAIVPVHVFGHPADMAGIEAVAARFGIPVVEDATEALGSLANGKPVGATARLAVLSFNGNKVITTGGGGAILTDDADLARRAKHITTTAKVPHRWAYEHDMVGFNYRLPNLNAALGCAQLEQLPGFVASKRALAEAYRATFADVPGVRFLAEPEGTTGNYWLNAIVLDPDLAGARDAILDATNAAGLMTRPVWNLMHGLAIHRDCPRMDLGVAEDLARRIINIPSSAGLVPADG